MKANYIDPALYNIAIEDIPALEKKLKYLVENSYYKYLKITKIILRNVYGDGFSPRFVAFNDFKLNEDNYEKFYLDMFEMGCELEPLDPQLYDEVNMAPIQAFIPDEDSTEEEIEIYKEIINDDEHIVYHRSE